MTRMNSGCEYRTLALMFQPDSVFRDCHLNRQDMETMSAIPGLTLVRRIVGSYDLNQFNAILVYLYLKKLECFSEYATWTSREWLLWKRL